MNIKIDDILASLFENVPYSEQTEKAKAKIAQSLISEYEKALEGRTELQALGYVMSKFGTLEAAAELAGYSQEEIAQWACGGITELNSLKKIFIGTRRSVYLASFFISVSVLYLSKLFAWKNPCASAGRIRLCTEKPTAFTKDILLLYPQLWRRIGLWP